MEEEPHNRTIPIPQGLHHRVTVLWALVPSLVLSCLVGSDPAVAAASPPRATGGGKPSPAPAGASRLGAQAPLTPPAAASETPVGPNRPASEPGARAAYAKLPLTFVPNEGQMDARVRYSAKSGGG